MPLRPIAALCLVVSCLALVPTEGAAQGPRRSGWSGISAGARAGRDFENHAWSLGAQAAIPLQARLELRPSGDYFLGDRTPFRWQLNADAVMKFGPRGTVYGGGGAAFTRVRALSRVKTGYNLFFGVVGGTRLRSQLFVEFRWTFVNRTSPFRLAVGVNQSL
ncbi:MAG: hypothetical protein QOH59_2949 [Gemmatimonadales bacterium]|jgi:opacity protein-like surface antigen|nr:hypothetical protein [Gemmatimonadales bacterium]